uniref:lysozyme inhibitor LprI family protein n=1 Tax=Pararhizobium sp. IMCC3301 TaxID=3067904 RepID=UPI002740BA28|nr:lysozyme inhibitor LprI family protein [Pararhizobium sp. IMCC3301]
MKFMLAFLDLLQTIFRFLVVFIVCLSFFALPALSMTFKVEPSPINGEVTLVVGKGVIATGDAARFEAAIRAYPPNFRALMVTSGGGNVASAVELAIRIKAHSFSVIAHQECASACAMILFPAGEYSILTKGSMLGIHSCSASGVRHELCNESIAKLAISNGFPFGTLERFSDLYGPREMKWMTEISARCFGFYRGSDDPKPIHGGRKACVDGVIYAMGSEVRPRPFGPSFNCANAKTKVERLFCMDKELMQSDSILGLVYDAKMAEKSIRGRETLRTNQHRWIAARNANCEQRFNSSMDFMNTRDAALCLYKYNEDRIYSLIDNPPLIQK